jgi:hypothetical protein
LFEPENRFEDSTASYSALSLVSSFKSTALPTNYHARKTYHTRRCTGNPLRKGKKAGTSRTTLPGRSLVTEDVTQQIRLVT